MALLLFGCCFPTGLHFTEALLQGLQAGPKSISPCYLTLHVVGAKTEPYGVITYMMRTNTAVIHPHKQSTITFIITLITQHP